jgi:hypothetical protein
MPLPFIFALYASILAYGAATYFLGESLQLLTVVVGFGLLIVPYLTFEWVAAPVVALAMGFQARWSFMTSIVLGVPLVVLFTVITPVISSGNSSLPIPVPWLSVFEIGKSEVIPIIRERLIWWAGAYLAGMLIGWISRFVRPATEQNC